MALWTRRRLLGAGLTTIGAAWLPGCSRPEKKGDGHDASFDESCAFEETLQSLMKETSDAFDPLMAALRDGVSPNVLYAVAMNASARLMTPDADPDMHTQSPMRAAQLLASRQTPAHSLLPLFWAWDHLVVLRPNGLPLAFPDTAAWPAPANAAQALTDAFDAWDPDAADAAVGALYASGGPEAVIPPLTRYAMRHYEWLGHRAIWTTFALRGLDDFGWDCAPWILRSVARSLAGPQDAPGHALYDATLLRLPEVPATWRAGTDQPLAVPGLLASFRGGDSTACTDAVIDALVGGVSQRTIWTALALAGVEVGIRWNESSFGVHQLDAMNALRNLQSYAPDDDTAKLCLLQAAAWCPLYRGYVDDDPPAIAEGIDTLAPAAGTPTLDDAFAEISTDMPGASRMLLNWIEAGGDLDELTTAWSEIAAIRAANADVHRIKYHAALLEEADAALPEWRGRLLLGIPLRSPASTTPLWYRYDEAMALIATLPR